MIGRDRWIVNGTNIRITSRRNVAYEFVEKGAVEIFKGGGRDFRRESGRAGGTLTSGGSGAWKEEMNMKLIVFRQVQPGATPCIYTRSPGKLLPFRLSPFLSAFTPPPSSSSPSRHSFHFSRPLATTFLLAISFLPPSPTVFLSDFSRVLSHNSTVSYQEPRQRQWTNGRRKVG